MESQAAPLAPPPLTVLLEPCGYHVRKAWPEPYNTRVGGVIMGARQKDVVEGFIHDEVCYDIPGSRRNSYIPAATSITLKRGKERFRPATGMLAMRR